MTDLKGASNLEEVRKYFDSKAQGWDERQHPEEVKMMRILEKGGVKGKVLDVACGTGVMIPFYFEAGVREVVGIDLSPKMIEEAERKFAFENRAKFLCGDAVLADFEGRFDSVVVFNAWPHFIQPLKAISAFARDLRAGGRLVIAHDKGRGQLNRIHSGGASFVSLPLPAAKELARSMAGWVQVDFEADEEGMYEVAGKKIA
ncbi:MAG: class I SAM-dependent methyltransferase [Aeriscardovia sp.]|nr:class I SAM-dependent methyltransferase [Aeriscardovia sp.]